MLRVVRVLLGYRDDLNLQSRWWHRLLAVLFALGSLAVGALTVIVVNGNWTTGAAVGDIRIVDNLRAFTKKADPKIVNTVPEFLRLPGRLGGIKNGRVEELVTFSVATSVCSADLFSNATEVSTTLNSQLPNEPVTASEFAAFLKSELNSLKSGEEKRYCMLSNDVGFSSDNVVKFEMQPWGKGKRWAGIASSAVVFDALLALVVLNLYYRGLVYIICGPRQQTAETAQRAWASPKN